MGCASSNTVNDNSRSSSASLDIKKARLLTPHTERTWNRRGTVDFHMSEMNKLLGKQRIPEPSTNRLDSLNKETLNEYFQLEKHIQKATTRLSMEVIKVHKIDEINKEMKRAEGHLNNLVERNAKEYKNMVKHKKKHSVKETFQNQRLLDQMMDSDNHGYLDAINKQEVSQRDLEALKIQKKQLEKETEGYGERSRLLEVMFDRQDQILIDIFDGNYGSDLEERLEIQYDELLGKRQRMHIARYKWQCAKALTMHAVKQLYQAIKRWCQMMRVPNSMPALRYKVTEEARNNLQAASQNLTASQNYLINIAFPYCKPKEIELLNLAIANIFTDMMSQKRYEHAITCYETIFKRASALLQWQNYVIQHQIDNNLLAIINELKRKERQLRKERTRLMKEKIKEALGEEIETDSDSADEEDLDDENMTAEVAEALGIGMETPDIKSFQPDNESTSGEQLDEDLSSLPATMTEAERRRKEVATPLLERDLAPAPNQEELFGDIQKVTQKHQQEMEAFEKSQEMNRARQNQGLQDQLARRRGRRQRMQAQQAEIAHIKEMK